MNFDNFTKHAPLSMLWMVGSGLCFVAVIGLVRNLEGSLPAAQASFIRYAIGLLFFVPFLTKFSWRKLDLGTFLRYVVRAIFHSFGVVCWFHAMSKLPVAEVTAIGYMTPVFVTLGAVMIFKEKISYWRIVAIILAFCGVLLILRPGFQQFSTGHGAQLSATIFFASSYLMVKDLTRTESPTAIVAMMTLFVTFALAPMAVPVWVSPKVTEITSLVFVAIFATLGHFFMTKALVFTPMVVVQPVTFLQLVWSTLLGVFLFGEGIDFFVLTGGLIIILSVTLISYREAIRKI